MEVIGRQDTVLIIINLFKCHHVIKLKMETHFAECNLNAEVPLNAYYINQKVTFLGHFFNFFSDIDFPESH